MRKIDKVAEGFKDLLPVEMSELNCIARTVLTRLEEFGYEEIATPMVEYAEVFSTTLSGGMLDESMGQASSSSLKLVDRTGNVLALRSDMTAPISRVVRTKMKKVPLPMRLSYSGSVFRDNSSQRSQQREFRQVGAELIGSATVAADLEMISTSIEVVTSLGISDAMIVVGDSGFLSTILRSAGSSEEAVSNIKNKLACGDIVAYQKAVKALKAERAITKLLASLPELKGGIEVIEQAVKQLKQMTSAAKSRGTAGPRSVSKDVRESSSELVRLLELGRSIDAYGLSGQVIYDLSLLRPFDYYSGMVFEVLVPGTGFQVGGGGRYDQLYRSLGNDLSAAGFALSVERLHVAMSERGLFVNDGRNKAYVVPGIRPAGYRAAVRSLQKAGYIVITDLEGSGREQARKLAEAHRADILVTIQSNGRALSEPVKKVQPVKQARSTKGTVTKKGGAENA